VYIWLILLHTGSHPLSVMRLMTDIYDTKQKKGVSLMVVTLSVCYLLLCQIPWALISLNRKLMRGSSHLSPYQDPIPDQLNCMMHICPMQKRAAMHGPITLKFARLKALELTTSERSFAFR
jgi:hypothetical protein